jgi:hypothetical protein
LQPGAAFTKKYGKRSVLYKTIHETEKVKASCCCLYLLELVGQQRQGAYFKAV